jgi:ATP-binding cassette subfamily B protein
VVVVDAGEVVEVGSHTELVERGGRYARLHASWVVQSGT